MLPELIVTPSDNPMAQALFVALQEAAGTELKVSWFSSEIDFIATCVLHLGMFHQDQAAALNDTADLLEQLQKTPMPLIHLSSYQVFAGDKKRTHSEKDELGLDSASSLVQMENLVQQAKIPALILRTSWLIAAEGDNLLTRQLSALLQGRQLNVRAGLRGAPVSLHDLARVIIAVVKQIKCGAENWGVMHYCSSDHCSEEEFAEHLLHLLIQSQFLKSEPSIKLIDGEAVEALPSAILSGHKLRDGFGIQPRSWRPNLLLMVKRFIALNESM